jgi:type III secretory pathway component EscS
MKFLTFSFKNEAIWIMVFAFAPVVAAAFILLLVYLVRSLM